MSDDPSTCAGLFDSPAKQVEALRFPDGIREQLKGLYDQTLPDKQNGGMEVTGLRLARRLPSALKTEDPWEKRDGWVTLQCTVTGARFAVPEGEPVSALKTKYRFADGTESVFCRAVHPELAADRPRLAERLVAGLGREIQEQLLDLISAAAKLEALSGMETIPGPSEQESSPESQCDYQPLGDGSV